MTRRFDVIVIGGGPAGAAAAIEAAARGVDTLLIDEAPAAGGQVYRAPSPGLRGLPPSPEHSAGDALRSALASSGVTCAFSHRVWLVEAGFTVFSLGPDGPATAAASAVILATGALERNLPIPGWTLPGVTGLAAATVLLKSQAMLPGRRVVVAGTGPLLPLVAAGILKGGGQVAAVVDAAPRGEWLRRLPALLTRPDLLARGARWIGMLLAQGIPVLSGHALARIQGSDEVEQVQVVPLGFDGAPLAGAASRCFDCDTVCYGFGLLPGTEASRLLGAAHSYVPELGGWAVRTDQDQRTSVPGLYAAGDGAGVLGVAVAPLRGRLAALAAMHGLGRLSDADWAGAAAPLRRGLARTATFGRSMAAIAVPRPGMVALTTPDTIVCRCEGVCRAALDDAIAGGATTVNGLKSATRCGMGPCGGRVCGDAAAALIAAATGRRRAEIDEGTSRPPLRPIPLDSLTGAFDYDDLPIPAPAPL